MKRNEIKRRKTEKIQKRNEKNQGPRNEMQKFEKRNETKLKK
jgi:hypothetical protein